MTDEKYAFVSDVASRKATARSARNRRTHNGKSGKVRFPSDSLTKKELNAMNGEVKSYRLNEPMTWAEFKSMPTDLKETYIRLLRDKFHVPYLYIGQMFGVGNSAIQRKLQGEGIQIEPPVKRGEFNKEAWFAWCNRVPVQPKQEEPVEEEQGIAILEVIAEPEPVQIPEIKTIPKTEEKPKENATPVSGSLSFTGSADAALNTIGVLLGGAKVNIRISWDVCPEEGVENRG